MRISNVTIGADPEVFIVNEKTNKVVSSIGLIPGTKYEPYKEGLDEGFAVSTDCILAEFNIPPVRVGEQFTENINKMKKYLDDFVKSKNPDLGILCKSSMMVDADQLQSKEAHYIGCEIDYNAYTEMANPKPKGYKDNRRVAGFHCHIGYNNPNSDTSLSLVKYLDMYLGVPSVLKDDDKDRRNIYGAAGNFRLCSYGLEYRSLGGFMLSDDDLIQFVWNQTVKAINACNKVLNLAPATLIQQAINKSDKEIAENLCRDYRLI